MKNELEILKDKSLAVFGEHEPPKNLGQRKLLKYINQCTNLNRSIDIKKVSKIFLDNVRDPKGEWIRKKSSEMFLKFEDANRLYEGKIYSGFEWCYVDGKSDLRWIYAEGRYRSWDIENWKVKRDTSTWFTRSLGSLVKTGHLIIIPKGYVLKKLEENSSST